MGEWPVTGLWAALDCLSSLGREFCPSKFLGLGGYRCLLFNELLLDGIQARYGGQRVSLQAGSQAGSRSQGVCNLPETD